MLQLYVVFQKIETKSATDKPAIAANLGFIHAFAASFSVIIVSELGDKTFFIAAIMAMKHPRLTVFLGAITALALMTILSGWFWCFVRTRALVLSIRYYLITIFILSLIWLDRSYYSQSIYILYLDCIVRNIWSENVKRRLPHVAVRGSGGT